MREFVTIDDASSSGQRTDYDEDDSDTVYVAEVDRGGLAVDVDEDDEPCDERDRNRTVVADLYIPLFCCRGPQRKLPPQTPEEALFRAAAKGREGLHPGDVVLLNGVEMTL